MKQIYRFEQQTPPILNENMLQTELNRRKQNRQITVVVLAGLLIQLLIFLLGWSAVEWYPGLSALCFAYLLTTVTGGGVVAVVYSSKKGRCTV